MSVEIPNHHEIPTQSESQDDTADQFVRCLIDIDGVSGRKIERLHDSGFETFSDIREADRDDLVAVDGIGETVATRIVTEVAENGSSDDETDDGLGELFG